MLRLLIQKQDNSAGNPNARGSSEYPVSLHKPFAINLTGDSVFPPPRIA